MDSPNGPRHVSHTLYARPLDGMALAFRYYGHIDDQVKYHFSPTITYGPLVYQVVPT